MSKIRKIFGAQDRVESGAIQFWDDEPGLYLRGEDAINIALQIQEATAAYGDLNGPCCTARAGIAFSTLMQWADVIKRDVRSTPKHRKEQDNEMGEQIQAERETATDSTKLAP